MSEIKRVLLITIDCLRGDHIHYNGYERNITPTIDKLAKEGSNFFMAFSNGPHTHYSFPSILTSTYPLMFEGPKIGCWTELKSISFGVLWVWKGVRRIQ